MFYIGSLFFTSFVKFCLGESPHFGFRSLDVQNIQSSQKQEAAKHCNCTIADVENALAKFTWAKEAQKKIEKLKEEGKPMPKNIAEVDFSQFVFFSYSQIGF